MATRYKKELRAGNISNQNIARLRNDKNIGNARVDEALSQQKFQQGMEKRK